MWKATGHCAGRPRRERGAALNGIEDSARAAAEQSGCTARHANGGAWCEDAVPTQEEPWKFTRETGKLHVDPGPVDMGETARAPGQARTD